MKKLTSKLIAGLVVAAIIVSATTYLATANESKVVAIVVKALGKAQVKQSSKWSNVGKGSRLYSGDEV